jgi:2'-5' RNA ligase
MASQLIWRWKRPLYIVAKPPPANRKQLTRLCAAFDIDITYAPERWHSTLLPLGESSPATIAAVHQALGQFDAEPFWVGFDHIEGNTLQPHKGQRAPGAFQRALTKRIAACGVPLPSYEFGLHLNLKYGDASNRRAAFPLITWLVEEIILIESTGGRHIDRGQWKLERRQLSLGF